MISVLEPLRSRGKWLFATTVGLLVAITATGAFALSCVWDRNEQLFLEIESVEVDGMPQEDLSSYEDMDARLRNDFSPTRLRLTVVDGTETRVYVEPQEATDE